LLQHNKPKIIIAHTIKGKGVSFMEDKLEWHYKSPNDEEFMIAKKELSGC
jgi:transketolase